MKFPVERECPQTINLNLARKAPRQMQAGKKQQLDTRSQCCFGTNASAEGQAPLCTTMYTAVVKEISRRLIRPQTILKRKYIPAPISRPGGLRGQITFSCSMPLCPLVEVVDQRMGPITGTADFWTRTARQKGPRRSRLPSADRKSK